MASAHRTPLLRSSPTWRTAAMLPSIAALRYASTSQTPNLPTGASELSADSPNLDTITLDTIEINPAGDPAMLLPETVGYLQQLGIDYGWGPTTVVQTVMEGIHVYGGLPWWGAILGTSLIARLLLFPLFVKSSDSMARTAALGEVLRPFDQRITAAQKAGDSQGVLIAMRRKGDVKRRAGIQSMPKQLAPMIAQAVIAYCGIKLTRAMAALPVPGLQDGGFLWLKDLTLTDGYLLLPIIMAGTLHVVARTGGETGAAAQLGPMIKPMMLWVMPGLVAVFMAFQPGALCVWFCGSGVIGLGQGLLLRNETVRKYLGIAPNYTPKPGMEPRNNFTAMMEDRFPGLKERGGGASSDEAKKPAGPYMNPTYQAPQVQRTPSRTINATLVDKNEEMVRPDAPAAAPKKGVFDGVKDTYSGVKDTFNRVAKQTEAQRKEQERKAFKRRAEAYEKRVQDKGRR